MNPWPGAWFITSGGKKLKVMSVSYTHLPQVAPKFFDKRNAKKQGVDGDHVDYTNQSHPV